MNGKKFNDEITKTLETGYTKDPTGICTFDIFNTPYEVDFKEMKQKKIKKI